MVLTMTGRRDLTPEQFLRTAIHKPIYVRVKSHNNLTISVKVTKSALRKGLKNEPDIKVIRFVENPNAYVIILIH
jgi:hypothetical protein